MLIKEKEWCEGLNNDVKGIGFIWVGGRPDQSRARTCGQLAHCGQITHTKTHSPYAHHLNTYFNPTDRPHYPYPSTLTQAFFLKKFLHERVINKIMALLNVRWAKLLLKSMKNYKLNNTTFYFYLFSACNSTIPNEKLRAILLWIISS